MKLTNIIAAILALAALTSHVAAFAPASFSVFTGLTPVLQSSVPVITTGISSSTALAMAKKKGKKGSAQQKNKKKAKQARAMEDAGITATATATPKTPEKADVAPKKEEKAKVPLAVQQKYEVVGRGMLEMRVANEQKERVRREEVAKQQEIQRKNVEARQRLFAMRVILDQKSKAYKAEIGQRALLAERLGRDARRKAVIRERKEQIAKREAAIAEARKQPKAPDVEKVLFEKYAAIENLSEKAFTIKVDLGMIQLTPDPDDPDYDSTYDDEYASGMVYLN